MKTKEPVFLRLPKSLTKRYPLPEGCAWVDEARNTFAGININPIACWRADVLVSCKNTRDGFSAPADWEDCNGGNPDKHCFAVTYTPNEITSFVDFSVSFFRTLEEAVSFAASVARLGMVA